MIQLKGLTIIYAPAREVDSTMICSENLKVSSPKGIVKTTSNAISEYIEYILNSLQKIALAIVPTMKPNTE